MKFIALLLLSISISAFSHSGGTDSNGCHHDHKRGGYHCHKSDPADNSNATRKPASTEKSETTIVEENNKEVRPSEN